MDAPAFLVSFHCVLILFLYSLPSLLTSLTIVVEIASSKRATHELTVGENLELSVSIKIFDIPLISISWAHEGNTLAGDEDRVYIQTSSMLPVTSGPVMSALKIGAVVLEDAGIYIATAKSSTGDSGVQFTVSISTGT